MHGAQPLSGREVQLASYPLGEPKTPALNEDPGNIESIARTLFSRYVLPFEATSILLIVAAGGGSTGHGDGVSPWIGGVPVGMVSRGLPVTSTGWEIDGPAERAGVGPGLGARPGRRGATRHRRRHS